MGAFGVARGSIVGRWLMSLSEAKPYSMSASVLRGILLVLFLPLLVWSQQKPANPSTSLSPQNTLFINCDEKETGKEVFSPVSVSEDGKWRAYVEVHVTGDPQVGCPHTTRLWVAGVDAPYRVVYLMPPKLDAIENGMEILGWAENSSMLLVRTEEWQWASDAGDIQQVLAIDARTGLVHEPQLGAMLDARKDKQCALRVTAAGFSDDTSTVILVRAQFGTAMDVDETLEDVPPAKRCANAQETWSFNFNTGEIQQVANTQALQLFGKFVPNPLDK
jgi:hypothetical protein